MIPNTKRILFRRSDGSIHSSPPLLPECGTISNGEGFSSPEADEFFWTCTVRTTTSARGTLLRSFDRSDSANGMAVPSTSYPREAGTIM